LVKTVPGKGKALSRSGPPISNGRIAPAAIRGQAQMVSPGIKLTPGGSGAKGYPLKRKSAKYLALSFATFDPFFQRAPDPTPSRSARAGASVGVTAPGA
jgi:hypothetical protein